MLCPKCQQWFPSGPGRLGKTFHKCPNCGAESNKFGFRTYKGQMACGVRAMGFVTEDAGFDEYVGINESLEPGKEAKEVPSEPMKINLVERLDEFLNGKIDAQILRICILGIRESRILQQEFNTNEIEWLRWNFDKIPKLMSSDLCAGTYFLLYTHRALSITDIGRKMGKYTKPIRQWIKKLLAIDLVLRHRYDRGWGREILYYVHKQAYPNLANYIFSRIVLKHGSEKLKRITSINNDVQRGSVERAMWRR